MYLYLRVSFRESSNASLMPRLAVLGETMTTRMIRLAELLARTGLSRSTLYRLEAEGQFPRRVKLGKRSVAWRESQLVEWIESRSHAATH